MRRHLTWTLFSCAMIIWAGTQTWAFQADQGKPIGLNGIMAAYAPDGLTQDDFAELKESIDATWKEWVAQTAQMVKDFYEVEKPTIEGQRTAIAELQTKLRTMEKALKDSRYRSIHPQISDLYLQLAPEVDLADAMLKTLTLDKDAALKERVAGARGQLNQAVAAFRTDMNSVSGGRPWLAWAKVDQLQNIDPTSENDVTAVNDVKAKLEKREDFGEEVSKFMSRESFLALEDALAGVQQALTPPEAANDEKLREELISLMESIETYREDPTASTAASLREQFDVVENLALDGGVAIDRVFNEHFMNYNLRVIVSEAMLNRIAGDVRRTSSQINDSALGARIVGNQTSDVVVGIDLQPSDSGVRFSVNLDGTVSTSSMAYTSEATIQTVGRHSFNARKPVFFDGTEFSTEPARVSVQANNQPVGASTRYSGGLFGNVANRIAMREANERRGQANAYTQRSISNEVATELNQEVDSRFSNASMELQNRLYGPLREYGLYPDASSYSSSDNEIFVRTRLSGEKELGGGPVAPGLTAPAKGLITMIHESLLTNGSNRLDLGTEGKMKMSEGDLRNLIEERLSKILDREVSLGNAGDQEGQNGSIFVFDQPNPIQFTIDDGEVTLMLRAGLQRDDETIPTQIITVPLVPSMNGDKILLSRGNVGVKPVERPSSVAEQVARANVMRQNIQKAIPERELDATFEIEREGKKFNLKITSIDADNGWLSLTLE